MKFYSILDVMVMKKSRRPAARVLDIPLHAKLGLESRGIEIRDGN